MIAVLVVRDGRLPQGGDEAVAECGGRALLACTDDPHRDGRDAAADGHLLDDLGLQLAGLATSVRCVRLGDFEPGRWSAGLAPLLADEPRVLLPGSADGRDLAPRLAAVLRRPLHAVATLVSPSRIDMARRGGTELHTVVPGPEFVATLQPGVRGVVPTAGAPLPHVEFVDAGATPATPPPHLDVRVIGTQPPDPASIDLSEAPRIVAGGAGLDSAARIEQLARIGSMLGASTGATRVVTDRGWVQHTRQIGTTGVVVDPDVYLAFGISGAVQHTAGLGAPRHVLSVNTDAHCPMMQLADLAIVADANETLDALEQALAQRARSRPTPTAATA
ncbi:MAG: mycofactocin-associated electron transfer flavoprotein alpha subunit [Ilumatobacteraceae bacterium]